jgi:GNAT superfamily N-acetyltransferase
MMRVTEGLGLMRTRLGRRWLWHTLRLRTYSRRVGIGLLRDLHGPAFTNFRAKVPTTIRQLRPDDDLSLLDDLPDLDPRLARYRMDQRWLMTGDLPTPWVAVDPDGKVGFMTFLLTSRDNAAIQARWGAMLPTLQSDEAMIEGIYTAEKYRGMGLMVDAGTRIVEEARGSARWGMGFVWERNPAVLRAGMKGGWFPFAKREERWLLFRRRVRFLPLEEHEGMTAELKPAADEFLQRQASR